jgi:hypothetical protein
MTKEQIIGIVQEHAQKVKELAINDGDGAWFANLTLSFELKVAKIRGKSLYCEYTHTKPRAFCRDPKAGTPKEKVFYGLYLTKDLKTIAEITTCQLLSHHSSYSPYRHDWHDQPDYAKKLYDKFIIKCKDGTLTHDELNSHLSTLE